MSEILKCQDCGKETDDLFNEMKSTKYGVIFENEKLCDYCADKRYDEVVENFHASESKLFSPAEVSAGLFEKEPSIFGGGR